MCIEKHVVALFSRSFSLADSAPDGLHCCWGHPALPCPVQALGSHSVVSLSVQRVLVSPCQAEISLSNHQPEATKKLPTLLFLRWLDESVSTFAQARNFEDLPTWADTLETLIESRAAPELGCRHLAKPFNKSQDFASLMSAHDTSANRAKPRQTPQNPANRAKQSQTSQTEPNTACPLKYA